MQINRKKENNYQHTSFHDIRSLFRKTKQLAFSGSKLRPMCWKYSVLAAVMDFFVQLKDVYFTNETAWSLFHHDSREAYTSLAYRRFSRITLRQDLTFHDVLLFYFAQS